MFILTVARNGQSNSLFGACVSFNPPISIGWLSPFGACLRHTPKRQACQLGRAGRTGYALTLTFVPTLAQ
ncbi:MAG: hypothetical protein ACFN4R_02545 [Streptococcus gordonii]